MQPDNSENMRGVSETTNGKTEMNNMNKEKNTKNDLTENTRDLSLHNAQNNLKSVAINGNDTTYCETKDCGKDDSLASEPEYYYYYYYDYVDSEKDDSFEPLPHQL